MRTHYVTFQTVNQDKTFSGQTTQDALDAVDEYVRTAPEGWGRVDWRVTGHGLDHDATYMEATAANGRVLRLTVWK